MSNKPKPSAVVFAKNVARVATFYQEMIAMSVAHTDQDHVVLDAENMQLVVHAIPKHIADAIEITDPPQVREGLPIKLCLPVLSIAEARAKASELGGKVDPKEDEWPARGFIACDGHDPEGNVIQLREKAF